MWQHNYEPVAGSLGLSALLAAVPARAAVVRAVSAVVSSRTATAVAPLSPTFEARPASRAGLGLAAAATVRNCWRSARAVMSACR